MIKLNRTKVATLVGFALGAMSVAPAFGAAYGMAQSVRQLSNFGLYNAGTNTLLNAQTDLVLFQVTDNASVAASLNGTPALGNTAVNSQPPSPPINLLQATIGTNPYGEDDYTQHTLPVVGTFARSDMKLEGVLINGIQIPGEPAGTFESAPAKSNLVSEVQIEGSGSGNSQTTSGTGGSVTFSPNVDGLRVRIDFNALDWLYAVVDPAVDMFASNSLSFRLTANNVTIFSWSPDGSGTGGTGSTVLSDPCSLNATVNATTLNAGTPQTFGCSGFFSALTPALTAGVVYNLSFAETTTANGTVVGIPEPGSLALVGVALAGFGLARRNRKSNEA